MIRERRFSMVIRLLFLPFALVLLATAAQAQLDKSLEDYTKWLDRADDEIQKIIDVPDARRTYENTLGALDDVYARLVHELTFPQAIGLLSPHASDRDIGMAVEAAQNEWNIETSKREDLYRAVKSYADTKPALAGERARLLEVTMRNYRRAGMDLSPEKREELKAIQKELSDLSIEFGKNAQEDETTVLLLPKELPGMPREFLDQLDMIAGLYAVPLDDYTNMEIWRQCTSETTRKKLWVAYKREGGERNVRVLTKMLELRAKAANMLGYRHSADFQTEILMTKNADTVAEFYKKLRPLVREKSNRDYEELRDLKRKDIRDPRAGFHAWDYWYYAAKAQKEKYAVDMEVIRQYFPLNPSVRGLHQISSTLYGLEFRNATADARAEGLYFWHPDVEF